MQIYSEFVEGDRKASITRLKRSDWNRQFDVWEVAMFINGRPLQRTTARTESEAETVAEDFVKGYGTYSPTLLNENVSNG
jgi:hypothetical protein